MSMSLVKSVNGVAIKSLKHMHDVLSTSNEEFSDIRYFFGQPPTLLFHQKANQAKEQILKDYAVHPEAWFEEK